MKKYYFILLSLFMMSCNSVDEQMLGEWKTKSPYYHASFQVLKEDAETKIKVLSYNDGTTRYKWDSSNPWYLSSKLKVKDDLIVDATTGASKQMTQMQFKLISSDSLEMRTLAHNGVLKELWIKKNNLKTIYK